MRIHSCLLAGFIAAFGSACSQADSAETTPTADRGATSFRNIPIAEADQLLRRDKAIVVLDVRTADEFRAGRIPGAKNVDFYASDFKARLGELDRDKTYLVHCKSGGRSAKTESMMKEMKFKSVLHLNEGFSKWEAAGKPVEK